MNNIPMSDFLWIVIQPIIIKQNIKKNSVKKLELL